MPQTSGSIYSQIRKLIKNCRSSYHLTVEWTLAWPKLKRDGRIKKLNKFTSLHNCIFLKNEEQSPWNWQLNQYQKLPWFFLEKVNCMLNSPSHWKRRIKDTPSMTPVESKTSSMLLHLEELQSMDIKAHSSYHPKIWGISNGISHFKDQSSLMWEIHHCHRKYYFSRS